MNQSMKIKLETLTERYEELGALMGTPEIIDNQNQFREYAKEYAQIEPIVKCFQQFTTTEASIHNATEMLNDDDLEVRELAQEELQQSQKALGALSQELRILMLPQDPLDGANVFLEIRAGTGGDEASLFAGDLFRMYSRYAEQKGWQVEIINRHEGEHGGFKEIIAKINGDRVYSHLKFESGAHRVQRVPVTESQGRVHTSACTVAIMPEVEAIEAITIDPKDLRIDTFRASGAGGQHINKTDSAIRITHIPTNTVVECQDERSQHKNKARALSLLQARILDQERSKQATEQAATRKSLVGSGDRSERIRTYNYPQGRVTDHRINLTLYKLDDIIAGDVDAVIQPLIQEHQADLLLESGE